MNDEQGMNIFYNPMGVEKKHFSICVYLWEKLFRVGVGIGK